MRTLLLLAVLLAGPGSTGEARRRDALRDFKPEEFQRVEHVADIPESVWDALGVDVNGHPLADPGSRWNATDVIDRKLPYRRLIFAGFSSTKWFIYYEHGGRGRSEHVILFSTVAGKPVSPEAEWVMLPQQAKSIAELRAALERSAGPPGPLNKKDAEATLDKLAPGVAWRTVLDLDLDGDGRVDFVLPGKTPTEAVVGVMFGASLPIPVVLRFRRDGSQGGICGDPGDARVEVEDLSSPDDADDDSPAEARAAPGSLRKGFRLDSGGCDAFHFFFDGKNVRWWRR